MRSEVFTEKNVLPRDPENISSTRVELQSGALSNQGFSPVVYDTVRGSQERAVEYLPRDTVALSVSECVTMLLLQLVPVLGLVLAAVWSFSTNVSVMKRTVARALLIVGAIVYVVVAAGWLLSAGGFGG